MQCTEETNSGAWRGIGGKFDSIRRIEDKESSPRRIESDRCREKGGKVDRRITMKFLLEDESSIDVLA